MEEILRKVNYVSARAKDVSIDNLALSELADKVKAVDSKHWTEESPLNLTNYDEEQTAAMLFLFNAISFSYWGEPKWQPLGYNRGTWNMIASLQNAVAEGVPLFDAGYLSTMPTTTLGDVLHAEHEIPLLNKRAAILRQVGDVVQHKYGGSFHEIVKQANGKVSRFLGNVLADFPSFEDVSIYQGQQIPFHKRAQLLSSDVAHLFGLKGTENLTACADYILPMVLREEEVLRYSDSLAEKVDNRVEVPKGSPQEVEIRAQTLVAVEKLSGRTGLTQMQVNDYLWLAGNDVPADREYHLTRTTAY